MEILKIPQADSTNSWLAAHEKDLADTTLVYCHTQTAGRGQRGNSWESEPGKNITASLLLHPRQFHASLQFSLSEAVALAITHFLDKLGVDAKVKWPNDIYVDDGKICGILVEHVVTGTNISRTIAGFGININQEVFLSDAPNPVSVTQFTGKKYEPDTLMPMLADSLRKYLDKVEAGDLDSLHGEFLEKLWRKDGVPHKFFDRVAREHIEAVIDTVDRDGMLRLTTLQGDRRKYAFKEIEFILE